MAESSCARRGFLVLSIDTAICLAGARFAWGQKSQPMPVNELQTANSLPTVLVSQFWIAAPCIDTDVPGYLVLRAKAEYQHIDETPVQLQSELGVILGTLESAISKVTGAQHVYIARFSEASASLHFHLFPRTASIASQFLGESALANGDVNGPLLFDWARRKYHVDQPSLLSTETIRVAEKIRSSVAA
jgi:diadenosine tetraphosphate (Ap4A) HIT family hydrolase